LNKLHTNLFDNYFIMEFTNSET